MTSTTRRRHLQQLLATCGLGMLPACATILHPERKGNYKGRIDVGPLILDILWFIPGLVPGIIAIAVDFSSGAIYLGGGRAAGPEPQRLAIGPGETMTVRAPEIEGSLDVELRLRDAHDRIIDRSRGHWHAGRGDDLRVAFASAHAAGAGRGHLELARPGTDGPTTARYPLQLGLEPTGLEPRLATG